MKWQPWKNDYEIPVATNEGEPIAGPPCRHCMHWNPQANFADGPKGQIYVGVRLCHADEMEHDFSCFIDQAAESVSEQP